MPEPPTAVFAANDLQALGVYQAAHRAGLRVPQDLTSSGSTICRWRSGPTRR
ncbi:substrate-binding domain-containing protein [Herbidospora cretacea]|uniref:substrate-binding domain-containing protein n=1 Tax=Herbidospora cretacea TaxID=28444 RepID=UPI000AB146B0|nr:substrate-binding domain-containing protein [Herbidospora cretacea]